MHTKTSRRAIPLILAALGLAVVAGIVLSARLQAQSTDTGATGGSSSSSSTSTSASSSVTPANAPPVVALSVLSANAQVSGFRPGVRAYYTTTITDDQSLKSVIVTTSSMMYSGSTNTMVQCPGTTSCEEKVYIIVPANAGAHFVTVTATDSADQVTVKTVTFNANACSTDADCGGGSIQWAGATTCGSEAGSGLETDIMQYAVAATCKSGGICDTSSQQRVKQKCASGQVCTFGYNGVNLCIAPAAACTVGAQITSVCTCGNATLNYPYDWRVSMPTYCCFNNGSYSVNGGSPCPAPSVPSTVQAASSSSALKPAAASASTLATPASAAGASTTASPASSSPSSSTGTTNSSATVTPVGSPLSPVSPLNSQNSPSTPNAQPAIPATETPDEPARKLTKSQMRTLSSRRKSILRELIVLNKTLKLKRNTDALAHLEELREDVKAFTPVDTSAYETILDFQDEVAELRLEAAKKAVKRSVR